MRVVILDSEDAVSSYVSAYICQRITEFNPSAQRPFVLGLPTTGTSTVSTFQKLVDFYRRNKVSFEHVAVFGMEEFVGLPRDHPASCHSYLWNHLFKHVNIKPENVHMLNGNALDLFAEHKAFEAKIASYGGIDLFFSGTAARQDWPVTDAPAPDSHCAVWSLPPRTRCQAWTRMAGLRRTSPGVA